MNRYVQFRKKDFSNVLGLFFFAFLATFVVGMFVQVFGPKSLHWSLLVGLPLIWCAPVIPALPDALERAKLLHQLKRLRGFVITDNYRENRLDEIGW